MFEGCYTFNQYYPVNTQTVRFEKYEIGVAEVNHTELILEGPWQKATKAKN